MDFTLTDDQRELRDLAARILSDAVSDKSLRDFAGGGAPYDAAIWKTLADAGLLGLAISENAGGLGLGMVELGLLLEEQGRTLAPIPLTAAIALGAVALDRHGSAAQKAAWLPGVIAGETILAAAIEEMGGIDPIVPATRALPDGNGWRLTGTKMAVPYGAEAAAILVTAMTAGRSGLVPRRSRRPGRARRAAAFDQRRTSSADHARWRRPVGRCLDRQRRGRHEDRLGSSRAWTGRARAAPGRRRRGKRYGARPNIPAGVPSLVKPWGRSRRSSSAPPTASSTSRRCDRPRCSQPGNSIGTKCRPRTWPTAKYWAAMGGHRVVHTAQHLHGGMGADVTYPIHRFFLVATQISEALGGAAPMAAKIGREVAAGNAAPLA